MLKHFKKLLLLLLVVSLCFPAVPVQAMNTSQTIPFSDGNTQFSFSVGDNGQFQTPSTYTKDSVLYTVDSVTFNSYNVNVLSIDSTGNFQALSPGYAEVILQLYTNQTISNTSDYYCYNCGYYCGYSSVCSQCGCYNDTNNYWQDTSVSSTLLTEVHYQIYVCPDMSNVTLDTTSQTQYMPAYSWSYPTFTFKLDSPYVLNEYDQSLSVSYQSSNPDIPVYGYLYNNEITLRPGNVGKTDVIITINDKTFTVHIKTVSLNLNQNSLLLSKGQTKQLKMKGTSKKVKWSSSNPKIATVSSSGVVKAKKTGNVVIKAEVGGYAFGCAVSVVTPQRQKVIKEAIRIGNTCTYSQPKRMQKNYYDCSSLVWKSYRKCGITFNNKYYAPVAADIGKWCASKKKLVKGGLSEKNISKMKLNAGDLMFQTGSSNGRYKGIYHVEMITGYTCYGFYENGEPILSLTWATRSDGYYGAGGQMVGRP